MPRLYRLLPRRVHTVPARIFGLLTTVACCVLLLVGCDDDSPPELGHFEGSYDYTAFSTDGPAVTLHGTLEITGVDSSRGTASASLQAQGHWAGVPVQLTLAPDARVFLDTEGGVLIQDEGTAVIGIGDGDTTSFTTTHSGILTDGGVIQGTFTLEIQGHGTTGGDFNAVRHE